MKKISIIEKLRLAFSEEAEVEFVEVKTTDGVVLKVDKIEEGSVVTVVTGEGEEMTEAVSGEAEYTLEDGSKISVDAEGKIVTVTEKQSEETLEMSAILEAVKEASKEDVDVMLSAIDNLAKIVLEQEEKIEKFAKAPATEAKKVEKAVAKKAAKELTPIEAIAAFRAAQKS